MRKSIQIDVSTHEELTVISGEMQIKERKKVSMEQAILNLIESWRKKK